MTENPNNAPHILGQHTVVVDGQFMAKIHGAGAGDPQTQWVDICKLHPRYRGKTRLRRLSGNSACKNCMRIWRKVKPLKKEKRNIVQRHHVTYDPEVVVLIRQTEHWALTGIQRLGQPYSRGFIQSLAAVVVLHGPAAEELMPHPGEEVHPVVVPAADKTKRSLVSQTHGPAGS